MMLREVKEPEAPPKKVVWPAMFISPSEFNSLNVRQWGLPTGGHEGRMWKTQVLWHGKGEKILGWRVYRMEKHPDPNKLMICGYFPIAFAGAPRRQTDYSDSPEYKRRWGKES